MFKCNQCGLCCKLFNQIDIPQGYEVLNDGSGECIYLKNNLCSIYENRPPLCNSDWVYKNRCESYMSREDFDAMITLQCEALKEKYGRKVNGK